MSRVQELEAAGATIVNITEPLPHLTEIQVSSGYRRMLPGAEPDQSLPAEPVWLGRRSRYCLGSFIQPL